MSDIVAIKRALTDRVKDVAEKLLPGGIREGREWSCGSIHGERGHSLKLCLDGEKRGTWADFAADGEAGDIIDLWCAVTHQALPEALDDIRSWLGMPKPEFDGKRDRQFKRPQKPRSVTPVGPVRQWLTNDRMLTNSAITAYRIGEDGHRAIFEFLDPNGKLIFAKWRSIKADADGKFGKGITEAGLEPILFGWQAINRDAREITICEGEIDAPTLYDYGWPALSVPLGGGGGNKQAWIESEYDRLLQFEVIYLALDNDEQGDLAAAAISKRLGPHRCRRVVLPHKDANDCRKAGVTTEEILRCFATAKSLDPDELKRAGEFTDDVTKLFWPKDEDHAGYRMPFSSIGTKLLFRPAEVTIWTGATGAGKSQLLSYASVDWIKQGARLCIASLEMQPRQLLKRMVKQAGNLDRPTEGYIRAIMDWIDQGTWLFAVTGKSPVQRILEIFEYARCRYGCDVFIIDSLMRLGVGSEDYQAQEQVVFEIVNWATSKGVHMHLVAHARKASKDHSGPGGSEDVKGASEIASNAFNIISVWRNEKAEDELRRAEEGFNDGDQMSANMLDSLRGKATVIMNVAKQRNGDYEGKTGLWFNQASYQYRCRDDSRDGHRYVGYAAESGDTKTGRAA